MANDVYYNLLQFIFDIESSMELFGSVWAFYEIFDKTCSLVLFRND